MITNADRNLSIQTRNGFSLVELLSAVGILVILLAVALPQFGQATQRAEEVTAKRNAQTLVSIAQSASAAGLEFVDPSGNLETTVTNVTKGGRVVEGPLEGTWFGVALTKQEQDQASVYLRVKNGTLAYKRNG